MPLVCQVAPRASCSGTPEGLTETSTSVTPGTEAKGSDRSAQAVRGGWWTAPFYEGAK